MSISQYPRSGSRWEIKIGPDIPHTLYVVIAAGHGSVFLEQVDGDHIQCIDIWNWDKYLPVAKEEKPKFL